MVLVVDVYWMKFLLLHHVHVIFTNLFFLPGMHYKGNERQKC